MRSRSCLLRLLLRWEWWESDGWMVLLRLRELNNEEIDAIVYVFEKLQEFGVTSQCFELEFQIDLVPYHVFLQTK